MARRKRDKRDRRERRYHVATVVTAPTARKTRRDPLRIARTILIQPIVLPRRPALTRSGRVPRREDRRTFRPEIVPPLAGLRSRPRVVPSRDGRRVAFAPRRLPDICRKRSERRQVMFANGRGGTRVRRGRRNRWSHISCRR